MSSPTRIGVSHVTETGFSLMGATLGAILFITAGREPLRRLLATLRNR